MPKNLKSSPIVHTQLGSRSTRASNSPLTPPLAREPRKKRRIDTHSQIPQPAQDEDEHEVDSDDSGSNDGDKDDGDYNDDGGDEHEGGKRSDQVGNSSPEGLPSNDDIFASMDRTDQFGDLNSDTNQDDDEDIDLDVLPEVTNIVLNFRKGQPPCVAIDGQAEESKNLRKIKDWSPVQIQYKRGDGFDIFLGYIKSKITDLKRKSDKDKDLQWFDSETPYVQPNHSTRQTKFSALTPEDFETKVAHAYHAEVARERVSSKRFSIQVHVYVYLKHSSDGTKTLKRPSQLGIEEANRKISEARAAGTLNIGDIGQVLYARDLASSTTSNYDQPIPPPPNNALYRQANEIDSRSAALRQQRSASSLGSRNIVQVKARITDWEIVELDLTEIRRALGFDLTRIGETTRDPTPPPVPEPTVDMPDLDH